MAVEFYAGREPETTHEMMTRDRIIESLRNEFATADHLVAVVFEFSCGTADIDLAIFKPNGILVVELKECASPIAGNENGEWRILAGECPEPILKGGSHGNPYHQARHYRYALSQFLLSKRRDFLSGQKAAHADFAHVSAAVVISPDLHPDSRLEFARGRQPWFHIAGLPKLPALIRQVRSEKINLGEKDIRRLIRDVLRCTPVDVSFDERYSSSSEVARPLDQSPSLTTGRYDVFWHYMPPPPRRQTQAPDYLKDLNPQQRAAVMHRGSHLLILAGAGTGKTRTLTYRAASLLQECEPSQILLTTFTNKAANEMYHRIRKVVPADTSQMWVGTFHNVCRRILVEQATKLGYSQKFAILDADESRRTMQRCVPRGSYADASRIHQLYCYARNAMKPWQEVLEYPEFSEIQTPEPVIAATIDSYRKRLRSSDLMDFDDLLVNTVTLLEQYPEIRHLYQQRFRYILVDEYQDTSRIQAHILRLLASSNNVTAVGDDSQAIYGFRGATVENILEFERQFPGTTVLRLEENYRSTPEILALANANADCNGHRDPKRLFAHGRESRGDLPWYCRCRDQDMEASFAISRINDLHRFGVPLRDIAVLFRANHQAAVLEMALDRAGIPYEVFGAKRFFDQEHIKDLIAWLRLVVNANDLISLGRIAGQQEGLDGDLFSLIEERSEQVDEQFWTTAEHYLRDPKVALREGRALTQLRSKIELLVAEYMQNQSIPSLIQTILDHHYRSYLQARYPTDWEARLEDIQALRDLAGHYDSIDALVEQITLDQLEVRARLRSSQFAPNDRLTLSTVHAAKGLEWQAVFVIGLVEGWFPHYKALQTVGAEEERRLFHVAITRAKRYLHLTQPALVNTQIGQRVAEPSRFVKELPSKLYKVVDVG